MRQGGHQEEEGTRLRYRALGGRRRSVGLSLGAGLCRRITAAKGSQPDLSLSPNETFRRSEGQHYRADPNHPTSPPFPALVLGLARTCRARVAGHLRKLGRWHEERRLAATPDVATRRLSSSREPSPDGSRSPPSVRLGPDPSAGGSLLCRLLCSTRVTGGEIHHRPRDPCTSSLFTLQDSVESYSLCEFATNSRSVTEP